MKLLFVVLGLIALMIASVAKGGDFYAPLQAAHAGNWFDASKPGSGFDIQTYEDSAGLSGAFITYYKNGAVPTWYAAQTRWTGAGQTTPLVAALVAGPQRVGAISFDVDGSASCDHLSADVTVAGATEHYDLTALIAPLRDQCDAICPSVSFGPYLDACQ